MGFLLALLMVFNTFGGLVLVPAWIKVIRPRFLTERPAHADDRARAGPARRRVIEADTSPSASADAPPSTTCRCASRAARWSGSSARTAPARRRRSACWPASSRRPRARRSIDGHDLAAAPRGGAPPDRLRARAPRPPRRHDGARRAALHRRAARRARRRAPRRSHRRRPRAHRPDDVRRPPHRHAVARHASARGPRRGSGGRSARPAPRRAHGRHGPGTERRHAGV